MKVVVVGGGAGGLQLATRLGFLKLKHSKIDPYLVDRSPSHIWKPLLHEVATGALNTGTEELNYFSHGHISGYKFRIGVMKGIDRDKKVVLLAPAKDVDGIPFSGERQIPYDKLIMAVGSVVNTFGTPGVAEHCVTLDVPEEANYLRQKLIAQALRVELMPTEYPKLRIGIVGGGATGVELAVEIHHIMSTMRTTGSWLKPSELEITILEAGPRILAFGHPGISEFATKELLKRNIEIKTQVSITRVDQKAFHLKDGTVLEKEIKVWAAGVKGHDWVKGLGLQTMSDNRIKVNSYLQTLDDPCIYALGDCAHVPVDPGQPEGPYCPASAQAAHQHAEWLLKRIDGRVRGKVTRPFKFFSQGVLVSLGEGTAVGTLSNVLKKEQYIQGRGAKAIYESLYRMHQVVLHGWWKASLLFISDILRSKTLPKVKLH